MRTYPKIRIKGFTDPWEQRKLEKIASFSKGSGYSKSDLSGTGTPVILYGRLYTNYETVISNVDTYTEEKKGSVFSKGGEVIVPASGETAEDISVASVVEKSGVLLGGDLNVITPNKELESMFLALNITYGKSHKDMSKLAQGKSVVHLHNADLKTIDILYPSIPEQKKICEFFKSLDNLSTLHQRKCESLKLVKKSFLEKLFPKDGEIFPELRFKGFTDPWEQRKLKDIANKVTTKNSGTLYVETLTNSAEFGIISQKDFFDHNISNLENIDGYYIVENNDFVYNPRISTSAPVGPINRNKLGRSGVISPLYTVFRTHDVDEEYVEWFFKSSKWHKFMFFNGDTGARSDRFAIKDSVFFEMPIPIPHIDEQRQIGHFFSNLDSLITLHQRKCDALKNAKKYFLHNMFV